MKRVNTKCPVCGTWYYSENGGDQICKRCIHTNPKEKERLLKVVRGVVEVLQSQNNLKYYSEMINKIINEPTLINKYSKYNVAELLVQLQFNKLKWKTTYQFQHHKHRFRFDFYLKPFNLAIEIDEKYHNSPKQKEKDTIRDKLIGERYMLRIPEQVIRGDINNLQKLIIYKLLKEFEFMKDGEFDSKMKSIGIDPKYYRWKREKQKKVFSWM